MMMDLLATIEQFSGSSTGQSYSTTNTNVRMYLTPASNEAVALYEQMPQGQMFSFSILSDDIGNLKQQSRITVTSPQVSGFETGDVFITLTDTKRARIGGKFYLSGLCYKKE